MKKLNYWLLAVSIVMLAVGLITIAIGVHNGLYAPRQAGIVLCWSSAALLLINIADIICSRLLEDLSWKHQVKIIQSALAVTGFYTGKIDGNFGPETIEALHNYNKCNADKPFTDDDVDSIHFTEVEVDDDDTYYDTIDISNAKIGVPYDLFEDAASKFGIDVDEFVENGEVLAELDRDAREVDESIGQHYD